MNKWRQIPNLRAATLGSLLTCAGVLQASSSVMDRPHFKVEGIAIVWAADQTNGVPIASDFIIENSGANADLIAGDVFTVVTGTLDPVNETFGDGTGTTLRIRGGTNQNTIQGDRFTSADDVLLPFTIQNNTDVRTIRSEIESSFFVASNKAFNIDVTPTPISAPADLDLIRLRMRVTESGNDGGLSFGSSAQFPHTGNTDASGVQWTGYRRMSNIAAGRDIFRGNRRTASAPGSIADQSVRFDLTYRWNTGNIDLAEGTFDVEAEVLYTVYIP